MVNILGLHGNCSINGVVYSGSSIQIANGKVVIDGVPQGETLSSPKISIVVNGNAGEVHTNSGSVSVTGDAVHVKTVSGDVSCGNVTQGVQTVSGDVYCSTLQGGFSTVSGKSVASNRVSDSLNTIVAKFM